MDKSRSLGQKIRKVIEEGLLIILSLLLWLFILYAAFTIFGILFQSDNYYVLLGNSILKSSHGDIIDFFRSLLVLAFIVAIYLSITFRLALKKARCKEEGLTANEGSRMKKLLHKIYQLALALVLLSIVFFGGDQPGPVFAESESVQEDPIEELPHEENSILALNYHRIREKNFPTMLIDFMSNSKELQIYSVYDDEFEDQMKWLKSQGANFLTLDQAIKCIETGNVPEKAVWISFDDMDQTIYDNAQPILEKYDIPVTGFVITGQVGNRNFNSISLMSLERLVELDESGLWSFGLHTDDLHYLDEHNDSALWAASDQTVKKDTKKSQEYLEKYLENCRTDAMAYPYGQMNAQTLESLAEQGVRYGFTLEEKAIHDPVNNFYIPRVLVSQESFERLVKSWRGFQ